MLDEPTEGVWVGVIEEIAERLSRAVQRMALILVEQHVELALGWRNYAYVMDRGHVALEGAVRRGDGRSASLLRYLAP